MVLISPSLLHDCPVQALPAGTLLLRRAQPASSALYLESGRVQLGIVDFNHALAAPDGDCAERASPPALLHMLGEVEGPAWLEANAALLRLPSAVDAVATTPVELRHLPLADLGAALADSSALTRTLLLDLARAHRQQTELAVSRLAKDAQSRCAEWLLRHAESGERGLCSVRLQQRKRLIASQLGIAPETLSRVLRQLREQSLISGSGRVLNLVNLGGLRSLAGI